MKRYPPLPTPRQPNLLEYRDPESDQVERKLRRRRIFHQIDIAIGIGSIITTIAVILYIWHFIANAHT